MIIYINVDFIFGLIKQWVLFNRIYFTLLYNAQKDSI